MGKLYNLLNTGCRASRAHKESLLSMALSQTLNPDPVPEPPAGPEVGEDAEKSRPKT